MKPIRVSRTISTLTMSALTIGLLATGGSAALAEPMTETAVAAAQESPTPPVTQPAATQPAATQPAATQPAPAPSGGSDTALGTVSQIAQGLTGEELPTVQTPHPIVGPYAGPAAKSAAIWDTRGRPDKLIIVRRGGIDTVLRGQLQRHVVRPVGTITLGGLAAYVPASYLSIVGGTARLSATLVLTTGVTLDVGAPFTTLALTGGPAAADAASVFTGGGGLTLRGVRVVSADPVTGAAMPAGPGRPYILVSQGGRLDAADAVIGDLGATDGPKSYPGLEFNAGATGSLVRTTLPRNTVGLRLDESNGVRLENVTVSRSLADGLVLAGDTGTTLTDVVADSNAGNGVVVAGKSSPRPITGITTRANQKFGLVVVGQSKPQISAITASGDGVGGMEINRSSDVVVNGFTATDEPTGVYTHVSSARIALARLDITGGRRGLAIEKTTTGLSLTSSRVDSAELGLSLGGHQLQMSDVDVVDSQTAVVVERGAGDVTADRMTISGGKDGFIANPGTTGVVVRDLTTDAVSTTAVRALSPGAQILGGQINGSATGIDIQAPTTLARVAIVGADTGVRARTTMNVDVQQVDISAIGVGMNIADGTPLDLTNSRVEAVESIRGTVKEHGINDLSLPAVPVLGAIGVPVVLFAGLLEVLALLRQLTWRRRNAGLPRHEALSVPSIRPRHVTPA